MPLEIVLLPRDGSRINSPLSADHIAALDVVAAAFNGGRNHDGRCYQMLMMDGGHVDLSDSPGYSAGFVKLRNWDEQRADFVFQVMTATDRVALLINQSPTVVLSHQEGVSLEDAGYAPGSYALRLVASAEDVLQQVEQSFRSWSSYRDQVVAGSSAPRTEPPTQPAKRGLAALVDKLLKGGRA